jgi:chromatin remodeling complex protein RSC6
MSTEERIKNVLLTLNNLKKEINSLQSEVKTLDKNIKKDNQRYSKMIKKKKQKKEPSGFARPSPVSTDLLKFMNKTEGEEVARTEVTKYLISYIKRNNLQNKDNQKIIEPNEELKELLNCGNEVLNYFNFQKFMNKHFLKKEEPIATL